jgi:hypothetical protein
MVGQDRILRLLYDDVEESISPQLIDAVASNRSQSLCRLVFRC